jgi:hypothetical protein
VPDANDHDVLAGDAKLHDIGLRASLDEQLAEIQPPWDAAAALREAQKRARRVLDETGNITLGSARRLA